MRIYLVRHGESQANVDANFLRTCPDRHVKLTPAGLVQASHAGDWLAGRLERFHAMAIFAWRSGGADTRGPS